MPMQLSSSWTTVVNIYWRTGATPSSSSAARPGAFSKVSRLPRSRGWISRAKFNALCLATRSRVPNHIISSLALRQKQPAMTSACFLSLAVGLASSFTSSPPCSSTRSSQDIRTGQSQRRRSSNIPHASGCSTTSRTNGRQAAKPRRSAFLIFLFLVTHRVSLQFSVFQHPRLRRRVRDIRTGNDLTPPRPAPTSLRCFPAHWDD